MKKLNLLDQSTNFKVNDTGTIIPFNAFENKQPFGITKDDTPVFRIKNDMGFLKAVNATTAAGGYIFQLNTKDLVGLVPGTYEIELVVDDVKTNSELIFPDTGFCSFNITTSALTITGTQIPTMSLDSFKQQLEQYVQTQAASKMQGIEDDFSKYVESIKQGPQGIQGPKGDKGESSTLSLGTTDIYKPCVIYDSFGKQYEKSWLNSSGVSTDSNSDITTDYFECPSNCTIAINTPSLDLIRFVTTKGGPLRISFYDSSKKHINQTNFGNSYPTPGQVTTVSPNNTAYARISFNCCDSTTADGTNLRLQCISIGNNKISMSSNGNDKALNLNLGASLPGIQGSQGPQGAEGPQGTIGDYVTGTGWLDLDPYMNKDVWCGWDSSNADDIGYNRYAVTTINGQNIFWFRIHSRLKDSTILQKDQTKLFDIPQNVTNQYGAMEWNQFNTNLECSGIPFVVALQKSGNEAWVNTYGYVPVYVGGSQKGLPTGTATVNFEGWYIL